MSDVGAESLAAGDAVTARPRAADVAVERIAEMIFEEFEPAAPLPSESQLGRTLGVSRLTVREAIRTLEARGLVTTGVGRRPRIAVPTGVAVGDFFQLAVRHDPRALLDLLEIRRAIEGHIASTAAARATRADIARLEAAVQQMRDTAEDREGFHAADMQFHEALASAGGNRLMVVLIEQLAEPLRASMMRSYAGHVARGLPVSLVIDQHAQIVDRVKAGDARGAAAAMRRHLRQTERDLLAGLAPALPASPDDAADDES